MGFIKEHFSALESIMVGEQKKFFHSISEGMREIEISPMEEVFSPAEIRKIRSMMTPKAKECYKNAFDLCSIFPNKVKYCEGYFTCYGLPLEHAFNKVGNKYVDITAEWVLKNDIKKDEYATVVVCNYREIAEIVVSTGYYGGVFREKYIRSLSSGK